MASTYVKRCSCGERLEIKTNAKRIIELDARVVCCSCGKIHDLKIQ